ncbi:MAG: beta-ketoacyl synthase chain length factor [Treponema sp.]|nr:beta-ketoacyl synthase chain length factor [Treponema sp.]
MNSRLSSLYTGSFSAWAPGIKTEGDWREWALGLKTIPQDKESPALDFSDPLLRRRLSQLSKMTIQVIHELEPAEGVPLFFVSFRGELNQQYKINKMLIEDNCILPAAFSLSVFNAAPALASIALGLHSDYTAIYPGGGSLFYGLLAAAARILNGAEKAILVYADEKIPSEYVSIYSGSPCLPPPLSFAVEITSKPFNHSVPLEKIRYREGPEAFLKSLVLHYSPGNLEK